ncbi:hypothetical protein B0H16DRAFT_1860637, partial [Mycena metata]
MLYEQDMSNLLQRASVNVRSPCESIWGFGKLGAPDLSHFSPTVLTYLERMKSSWGTLEVPQEWAHLILPPVTEPGDPWRPDLEPWLPLSLVSTILSPISSRLNLVSTADFFDRYASSDYTGPRFPLGDPAEEPSSGSILSATVDGLLCRDQPTGALYSMASLLQIHFPPHFGDDIPRLTFALVPEWEPITKLMIRRSQKAPLCFSSPALVFGIHLEGGSEDSCDLADRDLMRLARATQPHLEALMVARHLYISGLAPGRAASGSSIPPEYIFGIAFRHETVFIVAHIPYLHESSYRYQLLLVDRLPFPPYIPGDQDGVVARLRVIVALLTIKDHTSRLASFWDDVVWPQAIFDFDSQSRRECTGIATPSPSEDNEPSAWGDFGAFFGFEDEGEDDIEPSTSEIAKSKKLVDGWLPGIRDAVYEAPAIDLSG